MNRTSTLLWAARAPRASRRERGRRWLRRQVRGLAADEAVDPATVERQVPEKVAASGSNCTSRSHSVCPGRGSTATSGRKRDGQPNGRRTPPAVGDDAEGRARHDAAGAVPWYGTTANFTTWSTGRSALDGDGVVRWPSQQPRPCRPAAGRARVGVGDLARVAAGRGQASARRDYGQPPEFFGLMPCLLDRSPWHTVVEQPQVQRAGTRTPARGISPSVAQIRRAPPTARAGRVGADGGRVGPDRQPGRPACCAAQPQ